MRAKIRPRDGHGDGLRAVPPWAGETWMGRRNVKNILKNPALASPCFQAVRRSLQPPCWGPGERWPAVIRSFRVRKMACRGATEALSGCEGWSVGRRQMPYGSPIGHLSLCVGTRRGHGRVGCRA